MKGMNEAETRAEHIDPALQAAGWGVVDGSRIRREYPITLGRLEGFGRRARALTADYVLIFPSVAAGPQPVNLQVDFGLKLATGVGEFQALTNFFAQSILFLRLA